MAVCFCWPAHKIALCHDGEEFNPMMEAGSALKSLMLA